MTPLRKESPSDLYSCARAIRTSVYTGLGTSRMRECILSYGVIAFDCLCREIRATGSTYCSYTRIGAEASEHLNDSTLMYSGSNMGHKNQFQRVSSMTTLILLSGATNMTAASGPSRLQGSGTLSRSLVHLSQLPLLKVKHWISMNESRLSFVVLMVLFKTCCTSEDPRHGV